MYVCVDKHHYMLLTVKEYADIIAKCHYNTVIRRIKNKCLPSNHVVRQGRYGIATMIDVQGAEPFRFTPSFFAASKEYDALKSNDIKKNRELAAELSIKFDISTIAFFKEKGL